MQTVLIFLIRVYRLLLSPHIGNQCRFSPTCSHYTEDAIKMHGAFYGAYLGARRIVRCAPWCEGGHDPVPAQKFAFYQERNQ